MHRRRLGRFRVATLQEVAEYGGTLPKGLLPPIAGGAETYLGRVGSNNVGGLASITITSLLTLPVGSLAIVSGQASSLAASTARCITAVSDSGGNTWQHDIAGSTTSDNHPLDVWSSVLTTALTTSSTFTLTMGATDNYTCVIDAFSGVVAPQLDVAVNQAAGGTSNSVTPTKGGDLLYAVLGERSQGSFTPTVSAGWTGTAIVRNSTLSLVFPAYQLGFGTGTATATFSGTAGNPVVAIVAYGGGGASGFFAFM